MVKPRLDKAIACFSLPASCASCLGSPSLQDEDAERMALMRIHAEQMLKQRDADNECKTLASYLEPKTVVLRVSMHCNGCARKVEKHIMKIAGVTSFEVDLESKKVVVVGDITPFEVLDCVSKIKVAELWMAP